ncbi:MAG: UvrB/UvrC motif-containing protein, partial [Methylococcaceae bacterium]
TALDLIRRSIPWSRCEPGSKACFDAQIGLCPGVCTGAISKAEYRKIIKQLIQFFEGKKEKIVKGMRREMNTLAKKKDFEGAAILRNKIFALEHIQDVALITRDDVQLAQGVTADRPSGTPRSPNASRIEAYDIAHIGGTSTVASMVVFENGVPNKNAYRKFKIKSFEGTDDVAAMEEIMRRRLTRAQTDPTTWPLPMVFVIDGGEGQVNRVMEVMREFGLTIPVIGIAKGFDRKQDRLVYNRGDETTEKIATSMKEVMQKARDEAHRFAGAYHRVLRSKASGIPRR